MSNPLQIKQLDKILNKEQRRFNTLVQKISLLREQISLAKELDIELRRIAEQKIKPVEEKANMALREWVFLLHQLSEKIKLPVKQANRFPQIMLAELEDYLQVTRFEEDVEIQELYALYEGSGRNFEEINEDNEQLEKAMIADMMQAMWGIDIAPEAIGDPEKMQEIFQAKQAEFDAAEKRFAEKQQRRKKTVAELAAAEKRKAAEASVKKTAKQIYLELVRSFHPDKEPDEAKRAEKTAVMQQITAAYQADDHLRLLELQMNLLASRDNVFANFDNAQLKYFNQTLQQQVAELQQELYFASPQGNGNVYGDLFSISRSQMLRNIELYIKKLKQSAKNTQQNLSIIREEKIFKEFVRDYPLDEVWF